MKRQISSLMIASTVLVGSGFAPVALNEASAKTVQQQQKVDKATLFVDGKAQTLSVTNWNKQKLYSAEQLSKFMSASFKYNSKTKSYDVEKKVNNKAVKIEYKINDTNAVINGKKTKLASAPQLVGKTVFVDAQTLVKTLGGDLLGDFLAPVGLVSGDNFNPQWVNGSTILVSNEDGENSRTLLFNTNNRKVVATIAGSDLAVSPNGKQAIYTDENGFTYLVDLASNKKTTLNGEDDSVKSEFVWSHDGKTVYFLQGDKSEKVGSITIADGKVTTIASDSLNYKSDLHLSADGKKLLYTVAKEGVTTNNEATGEVDNIDITGTEPQIYVVNLTDAKPAGVAVTTTTDNKLFPAFLGNGNIVYVSAEEDDAKLPQLKMIDKNGQVTTLISNKNITSAYVTSKGVPFISVAEKNGYAIYKVFPTTKTLTKSVDSKVKLNSFTISNDGKSIAATTMVRWRCSPCFTKS